VAVKGLRPGVGAAGCGSDEAQDRGYLRRPGFLGGRLGEEANRLRDEAMRPEGGTGQRDRQSRGPAESLLVQRFFGGDQHQAGQAHGLQGTGGSAHVAGVLGTDQDESEAGGGGKLGHEQGKGRAGR